MNFGSTMGSMGGPGNESDKEFVQKEFNLALDACRKLIPIITLLTRGPRTAIMVGMILPYVFSVLGREDNVSNEESLKAVAEMQTLLQPFFIDALKDFKGPK